MSEASLAQTVVLIPAYQPGQKLVDTVCRLASAGLEVVVVDDGSDMEYQTVFKKLSGIAQTVQHFFNQGKGEALKTGYRFIQENLPEAKTIVTADADGQSLPADIIKIAEAYPKHRGGLLLGVRKFDQENVPLRSKFGNILTRKIVKMVTKQNISDTQTGLRAFSSDLLDFMRQVPGRRFEYETNVLLECSRAEVAIAETPIQTVYENNNDSSHFSPLKDSWAIYREIAKFASASLISFAVDYGAFALLIKLTETWSTSASVSFANIVARVLSASLNFTLNRRLVFKHRGSVRRGALQYLGLALLILAGGTLLLNLLTYLGVAPFLAKIVTELSLFILSYLCQKKIIFKNKQGEILCKK